MFKFKPTFNKLCLHNQPAEEVSATIPLRLTWPPRPSSDFFSRTMLSTKLDVLVLLQEERFWGQGNEGKETSLPLTHRCSLLGSVRHVMKLRSTETSLLGYSLLVHLTHLAFQDVSTCRQHETKDFSQQLPHKKTEFSTQARRKRNSHSVSAVLPDNHWITSRRGDPLLKNVKSGHSAGAEVVSAETKLAVVRSDPS